MPSTTMRIFFQARPVRGWPLMIDSLRSFSRLCTSLNKVKRETELWELLFVFLFLFLDRVSELFVYFLLFRFILRPGLWESKVGAREHLADSEVCFLLKFSSGWMTSSVCTNWLSQFKALSSFSLPAGENLEVCAIDKCLVTLKFHH